MLDEQPLYLSGNTHYAELEPLFLIITPRSPFLAVKLRR